MNLTLFFNFHINGLWRSSLSTSNFCVFRSYPDSISFNFFKPLHSNRYHGRFLWEMVYHLNAIFSLSKSDRLIVTLFHQCKCKCVCECCCVRMCCMDDHTYGCYKVNYSNIINSDVSYRFWSIFCLSFCAEISDKIFLCIFENWRNGTSSSEWRLYSKSSRLSSVVASACTH